MASSCEVADCDQIDRSHIPLVMVGTKNGEKRKRPGLGLVFILSMLGHCSNMMDSVRLPAPSVDIKASF